MPDSVPVLIVTGFGLNCERETVAAFEQAGGTPEQVHLNDILAGKRRLEEFAILAFIGGFSFGDHLGAGTVFANRVRHRLRSQLEHFVADGKLIIGICNGFQTLTRLGLVPGLGNDTFTPTVALAENTQGTFRDAWVSVRAEEKSPCIFTKGIGMMPIPVRHGEGRVVVDSPDTLAEIESRNLVAMRYVDPGTGESADDFPGNPNGSTHAIAGLCDPTGRIFGLMPHPEAYLSPHNHPAWTRQKIAGELPQRGLGRQVFDNAVKFVRGEL